MPTKRERDILQKEIDKKRTTERQRQIRTNAILHAWKDATKYLKGNKQEITYGRRPIIELRKPQRTYRASRGKSYTIRTIREYTDWGGKDTFNRKPIKVLRNTHKIAQMRNYIHTERKRRAAMRSKQGLCRKITYILGKWKTRQLEVTLQKLQDAADNNDMQPIWQYQSKLRMN